MIVRKIDTAQLYVQAYGRAAVQVLLAEPLCVVTHTGWALADTH